MKTTEVTELRGWIMKDNKDTKEIRKEVKIIIAEDKIIETITRALINIIILDVKQKPTNLILKDKTILSTKI